VRLLLTRPREDAQALAELIAARGHSSVIAPVMEVRYCEGPPITLEGVQGVLATSANGVRALARRCARRDVALYAVGPQTAEAAKRAGFQNLVSAEGDATALVETVAAKADPAAGKLLHAAGAETAGRLAHTLQSRGFVTEPVVLYEATAVTALSQEAVSAVAAGALDGVLLFSPRTARIFSALVAAAGVAEACARLQAFCISAATASAAGPLSFSRVAVAGVPNQEAMLALLR
jgi:uroporphyrinogen-III synthase